MKLPWFKFYPGHVTGDTQLGQCKAATRGVWWYILCHMHLSGRTGEITASIAGLAQICLVSQAELIEALEDLKKTGTATVTFCNASVRNSNTDVTVINRRMQKESKVRLDTGLRVKRYRGNKNVTQKTAKISIEKSPVLPGFETRVTFSNSAETDDVTQMKQPPEALPGADLNEIADLGNGIGNGIDTSKKIEDRIKEDINTFSFTNVKESESKLSHGLEPEKKKERIKPITTIEDSKPDLKSNYAALRGQFSTMSAADVKKLISEFIVENKPPEALPYVDLWNIFSKQWGLAKVMEITPERKDKVKIRVKEPAFHFPNILAGIAKDPFYRGESSRGWKVDFDYIIRSQQTYLTIIEKSKS